MDYEINGVRVVEITAPFDEVCRYRLEYPPSEPGRSTNAKIAWFTWNTSLGEAREKLEQFGSELKKEIDGLRD